MPAALIARQRATLRWVFAIDAVMFVVMAWAGWYARSSALAADSLDNLGDAVTYGISLYAVGRGAQTKARVALFKGVLIFAAAAALAAQLVYRLWVPALPLFEPMGVFGVLGLLANGACFALLYRHRAEDVNMSSVWECTRNDVAGNLALLVAAAGVAFTQAAWPDRVVAAALLALLLLSASQVVRAAWHELRVGKPAG